MSSTQVMPTLANLNDICNRFSWPPRQRAPGKINWCYTHGVLDDST